MGFHFDPSDALAGVAAYEVSVVRMLETGAKTVAGQMETTAKRNAPWTDRTGNARRTMTGFAVWDENGGLLVGISGHMPYSPDLEEKHFRKYSILFPTVYSYVNTLMSVVVQAALSEGG